MFESLGFETLTAPQVAVFFALALGLGFGVLAEQTKFCFRRGLVGEDRRAAMGVWLTALATAILGTQAGVFAGLVDFSEHRLLNADMPILAILAGGLMFGAGMVLTRGCVSRLTVLGGSGNLRALLVLVVFAIVAHATLKGVLAPLRTTLGAHTLNVGDFAALSSLASGPVIAALLGAAALVFALRSGNRPGTLVMAALLGLLAPLGWIGTGFVLYDDFDPVALQSLSFTAPWSEALFFTIASTSIPATFGTGLVGGVLTGAFLSSLASRRFAWASFGTPRETGRYMSGAALMGIGGVLAGGCTVGAGLAGIPTLSLAALIAVLAIAAGALIAHAVLSARPEGPALQPAE